jgi:rfaE bifunctional protein nucleotidyltransferase chain/domain
LSTVAKVLVEIRRARNAGGRIVMTNGCFDLLHPGHTRNLSEGRALGTHLLVAVNSDESVARLKGPGRPILPLADRLELLLTLRFVNWVLSFGDDGDDTPRSLIAEVQPNVLFKGADYGVEQIAGEDLVRAYGGQVVTMPYHPEWSTSAIVGRIRSAAAEAYQQIVAPTTSGGGDGTGS